MQTLTPLQKQVVGFHYPDWVPDKFNLGTQASYITQAKAMGMTALCNSWWGSYQDESYARFVKANQNHNMPYFTMLDGLQNLYRLSGTTILNKLIHIYDTQTDDPNYLRLPFKPDFPDLPVIFVYVSGMIDPFVWQRTVEKLSKGGRNFWYIADGVDCVNNYLLPFRAVGAYGPPLDTPEVYEAQCRQGRIYCDLTGKPLMLPIQAYYNDTWRAQHQTPPSKGIIIGDKEGMRLRQLFEVAMRYNPAWLLVNTLSEGDAITQINGMENTGLAVTPPWDGKLNELQRTMQEISREFLTGRRLNLKEERR